MSECPSGGGSYFTLDASQQKIRGNVNGNVLIPNENERTPLTADPELIPIVERILGAYPQVAPNRTDIDERMLNTNSPQQIDDDKIGARIDQSIGSFDTVTLDYSYFQQRVDAFQLVKGQNPDSTTRVHEVRTTWNRQWTPATLSVFSVSFDRVGSLLVPEENAIGPLVSAGNALEKIGPGFIDSN